MSSRIFKLAQSFLNRNKNKKKNDSSSDKNAKKDVTNKEKIKKVNNNG